MSTQQQHTWWHSPVSCCFSQYLAVGARDAPVIGRSLTERRDDGDGVALE